MSECRICFNTVKDKLISPCKCSGSIKHIHQSCLSKWLKEKYPKEYFQLLKNQQGGQCKIQCELCKYEYKTTTSYLDLPQICKKVRESSFLYSILVNIPVIAFLIYKCNCMLRHLFMFIFNQILNSNRDLRISKKILLFFKIILGLAIRLVPISMIGTILPLFIHSTGKLMKQLWMETKDVKFEKL